METAEVERPSEESMWAGPSGERWLANATRFEESLRPVGDALLGRAALSPGQHVLDVGCGAGSMSLDIASRITPGGSVTGLDIAPGLVDEANRRAAASMHKATVRFVLSDAAHTTLPPKSADRLVSRFGIMFFSDPYAAFAHMHTLLRADGKLAFACWASIKQNLWMLEVRSIIAAHFDLPTPPPRTPGPFAFDEPDYQRDILTKANFHDIDISPWSAEMYVGGPGSAPESAADFLLTATSIVHGLTDAPEIIRAQMRNELTTRLQDFMTPGGVRMPASVWLTTARA